MSKTIKIFLHVLENHLISFIDKSVKQKKT